MNNQASLATPEEDVNMLLQQARAAPPFLLYLSISLLLCARIIPLF